MRQITAAQFKAAVELDPAWASRLTEPTEITDFCDMDYSGITHLSPLLHFHGKDGYGWSADFTNCKSLKIAEGKFKGYVSFCYSAIEKIGDLTCGKDKQGWSASFMSCSSLEVAEGKFEGSVTFYASRIETIGNLTCGTNEDGTQLDVQGCFNLKSIPIAFKPEGIKADSELVKNLTKTRAFIQKKRSEILEIEL